METPSQSTKRRRRSLLFWFFIVLAIPLSVAVVAYAAGYRLDTATGEVVVASALAIESEPKKATVSLNGTVQESLTPFIATLPAGSYQVEVTLAGHLPWEKQIHLDEGRSAIFPNLLLFGDTAAQPIEKYPTSADRPALPQPLTEQQRSDLTAAGVKALKDRRILEGNREILVDTNQGVSHLLLDPAAMESWVRIDGAVSSAAWGPGQQLAFTMGNEIWLWQNANDDLVLVNRESDRLSQVVWHPDGGYLFFTNQQGVWAIELDHRDRRQIWQLDTAQEPKDLRISNNGKTLFYTVNGQVTERRLYD